MAHGYNDFGLSVTALSQFTQDNAELAARLGSPYTILRSGHVLFYDTFENDLAAWTTAIPVGGNVSITANNPFTGAKSVMVQGGNVAGTDAGIRKRIPLLRLGVYALDCLVRPIVSGALTMEIIEVKVLYETQTALYEGSVRITPETSKVEVYTMVGGASAWVEIYNSGRPLYDVSGMPNYNYIHLAIDLETLSYKLLLINDVLIDLAAYVLRTVAGVYTPGLIFGVGCISQGNNLFMQIDNVIVVVDEQ